MSFQCANDCFGFNIVKLGLAVAETDREERALRMERKRADVVGILLSAELGDLFRRVEIDPLS